MISGLLLFGSSYNSNKKVKRICLVMLSTYTLLNSNFSGGYVFPVVNITILILLPILISKTKKSNNYLAILSMLIYSILIDVFCYYMYPLFTINQSLIGYIISGLTFNLKQIVFPSVISIAIVVLDKVRIGLYESKIIS